MAVSILNGFAIGFLLFVLAVGLSLVFGTMDVLNLAHGALFLAGAYVASVLSGDVPSWGGFLGALGLAAVLGLVAGGVLAVLTGPLRRRSHLDQALLTLGVAFVVAELLVIRFGDDPLRVLPPPGLDGSTALLGATYPTYRLALIGVGAALAVAVYLVAERTRVGALVRATVADRDMVAALGVDHRLVTAAVFAVGAMLATVAGVLGGPIYGANVGLDVVVLILALIVVVIGGLGS
ncbi:MAG: branched-chain amino acid ABC transporter permease, partial [Actinomycetota bacterium]|nr:branched-chain amino acid ABC transporter permease [Actinomycetota bacterium]